MMWHWLVIWYKRGGRAQHKWRQPLAFGHWIIGIFVGLRCRSKYTSNSTRQWLLVHTIFSYQLNSLSTFIHRHLAIWQSVPNFISYSYTQCIVYVIYLMWLLWPGHDQFLRLFRAVCFRSVGVFLICLGVRIFTLNCLDCGRSGFHIEFFTSRGYSAQMQCIRLPYIENPCLTNMYVNFIRFVE